MGAAHRSCSEALGREMLRAHAAVTRPRRHRPCEACLGCRPCSSRYLYCWCGSSSGVSSAAGCPSRGQPCAKPSLGAHWRPCRAATWPASLPCQTRSTGSQYPASRSYCSGRRRAAPARTPGSAACGGCHAAHDCTADSPRSRTRRPFTAALTNMEASGSNCSNIYPGGSRVCCGQAHTSGGPAPAVCGGTASGAGATAANSRGDRRRCAGLYRVASISGDGVCSGCAGPATGVGAARGARRWRRRDGPSDPSDKLAASTCPCGPARCWLTAGRCELDSGAGAEVCGVSSRCVQDGPICSGQAPGHDGGGTIT
jgi:hypothetical protein